MFLQQLFEAIDKRHAAFCFGRMNPPTIGHAQLINTVAKSAAGGDYFIFTSQSHDAKKNPLDYSTKVKFLKALFPESAGHIVQDAGLKTIIQVAHWLYAKGYRSVTFVAGSDRLADFKELLEKYNGVQGPNGFYQFDAINFVSSGDRDPDGEGLAGVSASAARAAAKAGDEQAFAQATGAGELTNQLYHAVRKGMNVTKDLNEFATDGFNGGDDEGFSPAIAKMAEEDGFTKGVGLADVATLARAMAINAWDTQHGGLYKQYFAKGFKEGRSNKVQHDNKRYNLNLTVNKDGSISQSVAEDASGYIPKNKREAKDPRWSNALTVDVHPDTPRKNMKALGLI